MSPMKRRDFLYLMGLAGMTSVCGCANHPLRKAWPFAQVLPQTEDEAAVTDMAEVHAPPSKIMTSQEVTGDFIKDLRARSVHFDQTFHDDIHFRGRKWELLKSLVPKFRSVQRQIGFGHFNIVGMDEFFRIASRGPAGTQITSEEKTFLEELFYFDAKDYGFQGDKVTSDFTHRIEKNGVVKVPYTGHYLARGKAYETYTKITKDVGTVTLTSGVRALAKQSHLFLEKGLEAGGNMSKASRSLAPPGYSFHGLGDFDVGRKGGGYGNFTDEFALTNEYRKLIDLGYVEVRYPESNLLGVRFEPWHIKV